MNVDTEHQNLLNTALPAPLLNKGTAGRQALGAVRDLNQVYYFYILFLSKNF